MTRPEWLFAFSILGLLASLKFAEVWTQPRVALGILVGMVVLGVFVAMHHQVGLTLSRPDNIPIVITLAALGFLYWLALRQGVLNDKRIEAGEPPKEAE